MTSPQIFSNAFRDEKKMLSLYRLDAFRLYIDMQINQKQYNFRNVLVLCTLAHPLFFLEIHKRKAKFLYSSKFGENKKIEFF